MTVRPAQESDASSIAAISIEVWVGTYLKRGVSAHFADYALATFTTSNIQTLIADPTQIMLVSENAEGIDGYIRVSHGCKAPVAQGGDVEIATLYVQPRHHGTGIGKRLLWAALRHCSERKIDVVWLATNAENTPAIAFYIAQGFQHIGETQFRIDDEAYLNNVYAYRLPPADNSGGL